MPFSHKIFLILCLVITPLLLYSQNIFAQPTKQNQYTLRLDGTADLEPFGLVVPPTFSINEEPVPTLGFLPPLRRLANSFAQVCFKVKGIERGMYLFPVSWAGSPGHMLLDIKSSIVLVIGTSATDARLAQERSQSISYTKIGNDALVFFVQDNNPVDSLSFTQLEQIYSGKITNWKFLNGRDEEIKLFGHRDIHYAQIRAFESFLNLGISDLTIKKKYRQTDSVGHVNNWIEDAEYDNTDGALGFALRLSLLAPPPEGLKLLAVNHVFPTIDAISSGQYPASLPVYAAVLSSEAQPNTLNFVKWMTESQGQKIVEKCGLVPLTFEN